MPAVRGSRKRSSPKSARRRSATTGRRSRSCSAASPTVCASSGLKVPSRASIYNALPGMEGHVTGRDCSAHVAAALYNLDPAAVVPGHQLAFYCFNYGTCGPQLRRGTALARPVPGRSLRGWRPRSRGLLEAVLRARGIGDRTLPPAQVIPRARRAVDGSRTGSSSAARRCAACALSAEPRRGLRRRRARDLDELWRSCAARGGRDPGARRRHRTPALERHQGLGLRPGRSSPLVEDRRLDVTGILATKLHAILDRGLRRDFFDLYVMLQQQRLGIAEGLAAMRRSTRPGGRRRCCCARSPTSTTPSARRRCRAKARGTGSW